MALEGSELVSRSPVTLSPNEEESDLSGTGIGADCWVLVNSLVPARLPSEL